MVLFLKESLRRLPWERRPRCYAGNEQSGAFDPSGLQSIALCDAPLRMIVCVADGCHAVPQKHRRHVIFQVNVGVDQSGQDELAVCFDDPCVLRVRNLAFCARSLDPVSFNNNDRIRDGISAGSIDQRSAVQHNDLRLSRSYETSDQNEANRQPLNHRFILARTKSVGP